MRVLTSEVHSQPVWVDYTPADDAKPPLSVRCLRRAGAKCYAIGVNFIPGRRYLQHVGYACFALAASIEGKR